MAKMSLNKTKIEEINSKLYLESRSNPTDIIKMDVPLFLRMLEYAHEDAKSDMDLHDVAEKAITLSTSGKVLTMADYSSIVGTELDEKKLTTAEKRKKEDIVKSMKKSFKGDKGAMYAIATAKAKKLAEDEISEAYVPDNIKKFAKQRGVSSLVNKAAGWAEKVGKRITGGTAIGKNYSTIILDMGYQTADIYINTDNNTIELYGEEVNSFPEFKKVYDKHHKEDLDENTKGWDSSKDTPEIKALMAIADDTSNSYAERDKARQKAYDLRAAMSKQDEGLSKGYWAKETPGGKMEESFKQLVGKLKKQGKSEKAATSIAGAVASYKAKGGGKGPTAKQKARMAETILSKLKGE